MKEGFRKFLGTMAVFSIFTESAGIGARGVSNVSVASVPGMTLTKKLS